MAAEDKKHVDKKVKKRELTYFPLRGRAEIVRQTLALNGFEFTPITIGFQEWPAAKPKTPLGYMPILTETFEDDSTFVVCETLAIIKHIARTGKKGYGCNNHEAAKTDMIGEWAYGKRDSEVNPWLYYPGFNKDAEKRANYVKDQFPAYAARVEKWLDDAKTGFLICEHVTYADIIVADTLDVLHIGVGASLLERHPKLKAFLAKVQGADGIAGHVAKRGDNKDFAPPSAAPAASADA
jgi:glutathione S-transferase